MCSKICCYHFPSPGGGFGASRPQEFDVECSTCRWFPNTWNREFDTNPENVDVFSLSDNSGLENLGLSIDLRFLLGSGSSS